MVGRSLLTVGFLSFVSATVHFKETFDENWKQRWVVPTKWKKVEELGEWNYTAGKWFGDENDKGIQTGEDARFYGLSAKVPVPFSNDGKDLVVQYTVKHEQRIDCGGAYLKLLGPGVDQDKFGGDTPYQIMFGPDICGATQRTHVILSYPGKKENVLIKHDVETRSDQLTHLFTLHLLANNSINVLIDGESVRFGNIEDHFDLLEPKRIKDPAVSKPTDWVDEPTIADPEDKKPEGWDDIPAQIVDPDAKKPDDWDEDEDGEWVAPLIDNPDFMGEWSPKLIPNPAYKGEWEHPMIDNPAYKPDPKLHFRAKDISFIGFELWQVKSGTIFDDIIITDSIEEADAFAQETFWKKKDKEAEMFQEIEGERIAQEKVMNEALNKKLEEQGGSLEQGGQLALDEVDEDEIEEEIALGGDEL